MWQRSETKTFNSVDKEQIWKVWTDINNWSKWNNDVEYTRFEGPFEIGQTFVIKPLNGPEVKISLVEVVENAKFTDCTNFPGAKMYGAHELVEEKGELKLNTTITMTGPLGFVWRKLVGEKVAAKMGQQMEDIVKLAQQNG